MPHIGPVPQKAPRYSLLFYQPATGKGLVSSSTTGFKLLWKEEIATTFPKVASGRPIWQQIYHRS
jgi:hypothetical protein